MIGIMKVNESENLFLDHNLRPGQAKLCNTGQQQWPAILDIQYYTIFREIQWPAILESIS